MEIVARDHGSSDYPGRRPHDIGSGSGPPTWSGADAMAAFEDYLASPTAEGAAALGRIATFMIPPRFGVPPSPVEIRSEHRAAFVDGFTRERMSQAAGLSQSWYGPPIEEPRA